MTTLISKSPRTIGLTLLVLGFVGAFSATAQALTMENQVTPAYVQAHPKEFTVVVTRGDNGMIKFKITHNVSAPSYHVAHLSVYHQGKLLAESHTPVFGKKQGNTFHFALSPETIATSQFDLSDSGL